jgi:hypothetical protein
MLSAETTFLGWLLEALMLYAAPLIALSISVVYFLGSRSDDLMSRRFLTSAHGLAMCALYLVAMTVSFTRQSNLRYGTSFALALLVPLALMVVSLLLYRGNKKLHWLQVPNAACLVWIGFVGGMAVTGDWL